MWPTRPSSRSADIDRRSSVPAALHEEPIVGGVVASVAVPDQLGRVVASENLVTDPDAIGRRLRDNSWLSPVLEHYIDDMADSAGRSLDVAALVAPDGIEELRDCVTLLHRNETPIVILGAGTTNFGQTTPLDGGVVIEMKHFNHVEPPEDGRVTVGAGSPWSWGWAPAHPIWSTRSSVSWACAGPTGPGPSRSR